MLISFTGVIIIATAKPIDSINNETYSENNNKLIGILCSLCVSFCYAIVSVLTRKMQSVHYSIVLFYYAIFSVIALWLILLGESFYNDEPMRVLNLSWL